MFEDNLDYRFFYMFRQSMEGVRIDFRVSCSFGCIIIAKVEGLELEMLRSLGCDVESSHLCCRRIVAFLKFFSLDSVLV